VGEGMFAMTPYPSMKMEEFKDTPLASIVNTPYFTPDGPGALSLSRGDLAPWLLGDGAWTELVFVDGFFRPELSALPESSAEAGSLHDAICKNNSAVEAVLGHHLQHHNAFTALNSAFLQDGAFLRVPRNVKLEAPVHFLFVRTRAAGGQAAHLRNLVVLEEGAEAELAATYLGLDAETDYFNNVVEEMEIGPNASLRFVKRVHEGAAGKHLGATEIHQDRDARLDAGLYTLGGALVRNQLGVDIAGEGASVNVNALYLADGKRILDNNFDLRHQRPHGTSRIFARGVLDGASHAIFRGHVYVAPEAQKTDSNQLNNNLLLSDEARVDTKPQLEIFADDVKCTHGTTTGGPNEETVFYFRSRAISESAARGMLTRAFANAVADTAPIEAMRNALREHIAERY
jgi:Fe-S cluster assembly protein SufD